ncbi:MAG TPA: hypothetical protein V6C81_31850 [Planktothrix sp.]
MSADWFLASWTSIGIEDAHEIEIQAGCRQLVSDFMATAQGSTKSYYNIDFRESRSHRTQSEFRELLKRFDRPLIPTRYVANRDDTWKERCASIAYRETLRLALGQFAEGKPLPSKEILVAIDKLWTIDESEVDYEILYKNGSSAWDGYLAEITREVPTAIPDYADLRRNISYLEKFFKDLRGHISKDQMTGFLRWYELVEPKLTQDSLAFLFEF